MPRCRAAAATFRQARRFYALHAYLLPIYAAAKMMPPLMPLPLSLRAAAVTR